MYFLFQSKNFLIEILNGKVIPNPPKEEETVHQVNMKKFHEKENPTINFQPKLGYLIILAFSIFLFYRKLLS